ncbi:hypothetical protein QYM36_013867, partial [Artemia franciscana]
SRLCFVSLYIPEKMNSLPILLKICLRIVLIVTFLPGYSKGLGPPIVPALDIDGHLLIAGILSLNEGQYCRSSLDDNPLSDANDIIYALSRAVEKLNEVNFFPKEWKLGLKIWDDCFYEGNSVKASIHALSTLLEMPFNGSSTVAGIISEANSPELISKMAQSINYPYMKMPPLALHEEMTAGVQMLVITKVDHVSVIAKNHYQLEIFGNSAREENICVVNQILFSSSRSADDILQSMKRLKKSGVKNMVAIGDQADFEPLLALQNKDSTFDFNWLFISQAELDSNAFTGFNTSNKLFGIYTMYNEELDEDFEARQINNKRVQSMVRTVYSVSSQIKNFIKNNCDEDTKCNFSDLKLYSYEDDVSDVRKALGLERDDVSVAITAQLNSGILVDVGIFNGTHIEIRDFNLIEDDEDKDSSETCKSYICTNIERSILHSFHLKDEVWVYIVMTTSCICVLIIVAIIVYILCRVWEKDNVEGSQTFTLLTLFSVIVLYVTIIPYIMNVTETTCYMRTPVTAIAFAFLFSLLAARSIMLSTTAAEASSGHISGCVQGTLFLLMFGIQIAITTSDIVYNERLLPIKVMMDTGSKFVCHEKWLDLLISYIYVLVLLFFLLLTTPFAVKSNRNYSEGPSFCLSAYLITCLWLMCTCGYFLLKSDWKDFCVALIIVGTGTTHLITVFIPKTYMMATSAAADAVTLTIRQSNYERSAMNGQRIYETLQVPSISSHYGPEPTRSGFSSFDEPKNNQKAEF